MKTITFFTADWCKFCAALKPHAEKLAVERGIEIEYIDVEQEPELFKQTGSTTIPTLIIDDNIMINPTPPQVKRALDK